MREVKLCSNKILQFLIPVLAIHPVTVHCQSVDDDYDDDVSWVFFSVMRRDVIIGQRIEERWAIIARSLEVALLLHN